MRIPVMVSKKSVYIYQTIFKIFNMKNLKKLSRENLKGVNGGLIKLVEPGRWCCCGSNGCSTGVYGDSNDLTCVDSGTSLTKC